MPFQLRENGIRGRKTRKKVTSRKTHKTVYNVPIISDKTKFWQRNRQKTGLWDYHFSTVDFNTKLTDFNDKIKVFRKTLKQTGSKKQAYMAVLSSKYENALTRFYDDARDFADFMMFGSLLNPKDSNYLKLSTFGNYRHLYFTKLLFKITIPLTAF